jgi:hypothetical protein
VTNTDNFFYLLDTKQDERDLAPCVAPEDTHHTWVALLRGGDITGPIAFVDHGGITTFGGDFDWKPSGESSEGIAMFDIIATLDLTATGSNIAELKAGVDQLTKLLDANNDALLARDVEIARLRDAFEVMVEDAEQESSPWFAKALAKAYQVSEGKA